MTIRTAKIGLASAIAAALLTLTATADAADKIRIGYSMSTSGALAVAAPVQNQAYELWRDLVNARGGLDIGGKEKRMIEFVVYDDKSEPAAATQIYEKLISDDKVDLLLTPYGTQTHIGIANVLEKHGFPVVGNTSISTMLRELKAKNMFFILPMNDDYARSLTALLKAQNVKTAAVMTVQLPFLLETKRFLIPALKEAGINVVLNQEYPLGVKDLTSVVTGMKAGKPDAILGLAAPPDAILYMNLAREVGLHAPFQLLAIGPSIPFFVKTLGTRADGIVSVGSWSRNVKWPRAKPFFDAYVKKWSDPPDEIDTAVSYASVEVLEQAVAKAGIDRAKLREVLKKDTFDTIMGPVKFDDFNINTKLAAGYLQMQNGVNEIVWPPEIATSKYAPKAQ